MDRPETAQHYDLNLPIQPLKLLHGSERSAALEQLKAAIATAREACFQAFRSHEITGLEAARIMAMQVDQLIAALFVASGPSAAEQKSPRFKPQPLALVALGGYGRAQMAPYSDIDLLVLCQDVSAPQTRAQVDMLLYLLWDLGLKVGHSVRSVEECIVQAKDDSTIRTALLEARFLQGEKKLWDKLQSKFKALQSTSQQQFIQDKLKERNERHERNGGARYKLEPNIKDGKGGLRDLQSMIWIAKEAYGLSTLEALFAHGLLTLQEKTSLARAELFLWTVRFHLHLNTKRAEERLTFDAQENIAKALGYKKRKTASDVERFMRSYFFHSKAVRRLSRILVAALDEHGLRQNKAASTARIMAQDFDGFQVIARRLFVDQAAYFSAHPLELIRIFWVKHKYDLNMHPQTEASINHALHAITPQLQQDPEANRLFIEILTSEKNPAPTLREMSDSGVLGKFVPDFARIVGQIQFDRYHHYTVDEHSLFVIENLHLIETGALLEQAPLSSQIFKQITLRRLLYVAAFLHDIAKGRGGDHSVLGAQIALQLCPRFGFNQHETLLISTLVREHLTLTSTAFKRDLEDPQTITYLGNTLQSMETLRLLLILTVADIMAVGPGVYNAWKAALLRRAYYNTAAFLSGGLISEDKKKRIALRWDQLRQALPSDEAEKFIKLCPDNYWLNYDLEAQQKHWALLKESMPQNAPLKIEMDYGEQTNLTALTIVLPDHPGNLSRLAGAVALTDLSINAARSHILKDGLALFTLWILNPKQSGQISAQRLSRLKENLLAVFMGQTIAWSALRQRPSSLDRRRDVFEFPPNVRCYNEEAESETVIEVSGHDRPGVLYRITHALAEEGLIISMALVATFGTKYVDVFYVHNGFGRKIDENARLERIQKRILTVLDDTWYTNKR